MIWVFWCLTIKSQPKHPPICFGVRNVFTFICQRGKKKSEILRKWVCYTGIPRGLTKCFGEGWGLTSQRLSSRLPRAQRESHGCDAIKAKKNVTETNCIVRTLRVPTRCDEWDERASRAFARTKCSASAQRRRRTEDWEGAREIPPKRGRLNCGKSVIGSAFVEPASY